MKRLLAVLLMTVMFVALLSSTALASNALVISTNATTAAPGGDATVTLTVTNNPGAQAAMIYCDYDHSVFTLDTGKSPNGTIFADFTAGDNLLWDADAETTATGLLATLSFKVAENVAFGEYTISFIITEFSCVNGSMEAVPVEIENVTITVGCAHEHTKTVTGKPAGCTEGGYTDGIFCEDCQQYISGNQPIPATGHRYTSVVTEPGCGREGFTTYTCTGCGDSYVSDRMPGLEEHVFGPWIVTKEAGCITIGEQKRTCECGAVETETLPALGHQEATDVAVAPTCAAPGLTEGSHCANCNMVMVPQTEIPALAHTEVVTEAVAPTCAAPGRTEGAHCAVCGQVLKAQDEIPALAHTYERVVIEPTCEAEGYTSHTCTTCGHSYKDAVTSKREHNWDQGQIIKEATCDEMGTKLFTCQYEDCDATYEEAIDSALAHQYDSVVTAPTCTEEGYTTHTCSVCGHVYKDSTVAATGHTFGQWTVTKEATTETKGEETRTCACGQTETREIPAIECEDDTSSIWIIIVIILVVLLVAVVVIFYVLKKKRA